MFISIPLLSWCPIMQAGDERLFTAAHNGIFPLLPYLKITGFNVSYEVHDLSLTSSECFCLQNRRLLDKVIKIRGPIDVLSLVVHVYHGRSGLSHEISSRHSECCNTSTATQGGLVSISVQTMAIFLHVTLI